MSEPLLHFQDASGHRFHLLSERDYQFIYVPVAKILPDKVDGAAVESDLAALQSAFVEAMSVSYVNGASNAWNGDFGDYYFPGHVQKLRLMYMYFLDARFFSPTTADAMVESLRPFGNRWFAEAEFEGAEEPELWGTFFCHTCDFYFRGEFGRRYAKRLARAPLKPIEWSRQPLVFPGD